MAAARADPLLGHDQDADDPKVHARPTTSGSAALLATAKSAFASFPSLAATAPSLAPLKPQSPWSFRLSRRSVTWLVLAAAAIFLITAFARRHARPPSSGDDLLAPPSLADDPLDLRDHPPRDEVHFYRSRIDPAFAFLDSRIAGIEPAVTAAASVDARATVLAAAVVPRGGQTRRRTSAVTAAPISLAPPPTPPRKMGLVAVPVGESAKARIDTLVRQFGLDRFAFMLFIWDHSDWSEFPWFPHVTAIRVARQAKFWYAKRFIPPEVALHYDYIWLLDDDMVLDFEWDPANATAAMRQYNVHFAQPALTMGTHFDQGKIEERVEKFKIGHWTNFVEMMGPIISRGAYTCAWTLTPWDTSASWGLDNSFYPVCSGLGYCRFAILDGFPMKHLDTKTFVGGIDQKIRELNASQKQFGDWCAEVLRRASSETKEGKFALDVCRRWAMRDPYRNYVTFREMVPRDVARRGECLEDPTGEMAAVPWWHRRAPSTLTAMPAFRADRINLLDDHDDPKIHARPATTGSVAFFLNYGSPFAHFGRADLPPSRALRKSVATPSFRFHCSRRCATWLVLIAATAFLLFALAQHQSAPPGLTADVDGDGDPVPAPPALMDHVPHDQIHFYRTRIDPGFAFLEPRIAGLEPAHATFVSEANGTARPDYVPVPARKMGLVAIPVGESAKARIDTLVRQFGLNQFAFMLFIWDESDWSEFDWFAHVTAIRVARQAKFWYAKRFIPPEVALHYDYIWLLDDDMVLDFEWDPANATRTMRQYNVHFAQSALTMGEHFEQGKIGKRVEKFKIGHWTNFVEMMGPIISRGAYWCAWTLTPWDTSASWGVDNSFYPVCSGLGYCRFAVLDAYPMQHLDTRTFVGDVGKKLREAEVSHKQFDDWCAEVRKSATPESKEGYFALDVCRRLAMRDQFRDYITFREMVPGDADEEAGGWETCFEAPEVTKGGNEMWAVPWWHVRVV
ncbi:hypothetical protein GGF31_007412 [Allomyces arbusculus]|nr:hypothetical protein GGF31_007412 [Allomyces arbusculus]